MDQQILIITCPELADVIRRHAEFNKNIKLDILEIDRNIFDDAEIVDIRYLENIFYIISRQLSNYDSRNLSSLTVLITAQVEPPGNNGINSNIRDNWNPILIYPFQRGKPYSRSLLFSWLLIQFPEVRWVFLPEVLIENNLKLQNYLHYLADRDNRGYVRNTLLINGKSLDSFGNISNLFDASGWRDSIKQLCDIRSRRNSLALVIDEEESYSYFNAYIAYKLGYRVLPVIDMSTLIDLNRIQGNEEFIFSLEDIFLNFYDKEKFILSEDVAYLSDIRNRGENLHLSDLRNRDIAFSFLKNIRKRIFITVAHKNIRWHERNRAYLKELRSNGMKIKIVYKPSGGIFFVIKKIGLLSKYFRNKKNEIERMNEIVSVDRAHSAPGRLLVIAEHLIKRAEKICLDASSIKECIHGVILALEAQELLGYRTPTTSLEAIALKHKLEVKAECMFYGVAYNIDMNNRFKEIELEVEAVSKWFHPSIRKRSSLNAQLGILTELVEILRDYGQFDEELQCLNRIRKLNRQFYFLNKPWLRIIQPLRAYIETLIESFSLFLGAIFFWPTLYGILGYVTKARFSGGEDFLFWEQLTNAYYTFFGLQPTMRPVGSWSNVISILTVLTGFLHLGIFISYLYNLIFRK